MGHKRIESVKDLHRHGRQLYLRCECGRERTVDARQLLVWCPVVGWPLDLDALVRRMPCGACGRIVRWSTCSGLPDLDLCDYAEERVRRLDAAADRMRRMLKMFGRLKPVEGECPRCRRG